MQNYTTAQENYSTPTEKLPENYSTPTEKLPETTVHLQKNFQKTPALLHQLKHEQLKQLEHCKCPKRCWTLQILYEGF